MSTTPQPIFDQLSFKHALSQFATGVTVITTRHPDGHYIGLTASSFNSVSIDPPLVLWSLGGQSSNMDAFKACSHYTINVLSADQGLLARQFATRNIDRFSGVKFHLSSEGLPLLDGVSAWFECKNRSQYDEGDHVIFVGEVVACQVTPQAPLVYHGSQFYTSLQQKP